MKQPLTLTCRACRGATQIEITQEQFAELRGNGPRHIQDILFDQPPEIRELFISQTCDKCWKELFGGEE